MAALYNTHLLAQQVRRTSLHARSTWRVAHVACLAYLPLLPLAAALLGSACSLCAQPQAPAGPGAPAISTLPAILPAPAPADWPASYPNWWHERGVIDTSRIAEPDNHAPLNQGQLWHLAAQGIGELDTSLAPVGGAGFSLEALKAPGAKADYHAAANVGQLKHAASLFYNRFAELGFGPGDEGWPVGMTLHPATGYPWGSNVSPGNLLPANIGQAKQLWSWDLSNWTAADADADGLPDWWERYWFGTTSGMPNDNADADGLPDLVEYFRASDPLNADVDADGLPDGSSVSGEVVMERWWIDPHTFREISYIEGGQSAVPRAAVRLNQLSWDAGAVNYPSSFGHRIRGYLIAPVTADYRFRVYGDDFIEFWLSPDDASTGARRLAFNPAWNFRGAFDQHPGQSSLPQALQAGQRYYFEVFHYGDRINDYFGIGWQYEDMLEPELIPGHRLESFGVDPADLDGDALNDAAERAVGLDPCAGFGHMGRFGDPDADGFSNHWELLRGLDPLRTSAFPARTRAELFPGLAGVDALGIDSWQLDLRGQHYQQDAFESEDGLWLASGGLDLGQYAYAYRTAGPVDQPFRITARVRYHAIEDSWAEAGLMLRSALDPEAAFYRLSLVPDGRVVSWTRHAALVPEPVDNGTVRAPNDSAADLAAEVWLRLTREGELVSADYSYDGQAWFAHEQARIALGANPCFGFATTAYDRLETVAAGFSDCRIDWDSDADGLWNDEERALGTDPNLADTDGDGLSDYEETRKWFTDPLVNEPFSGQELSVVNIEDAARLLGRWEAGASGELEAKDIAGKIELSFKLPVSGVYELKIPVRYSYSYSRNAERNLVIHHYVDDEYVQTSNYLQPITDTVDVLRVLLPHLRAGEHKYVLHWENVYERRTIAVGDISIAGPSGYDSQNLETWQRRYVSATESLQNLGFNATSQISPFFVEGRTGYLGFVTISGGVVPRRGAADGWYADIPLPEDGSSLGVTFNFQQEGKIVESTLTWTTTDVFDGGAIALRKGDSLRLVAGSEPDGSAVIFSIGEVTYVATDINPVIHTFTVPGEYTITATRGQQFGEMAVTVFGSSPHVDRPAVMRNRPRKWLWEGIDNSSWIEQDRLPLLDAEDASNGIEVKLSLLDVARSHAFTARIAEGGPIVESVEIDGFWLRENVEGYYVEGRNGDGVHEATNRIICSGLPEDVSVCIELFKAGVTFEDGSVERWIDASDLDEFGRYDFVILKPDDVLGSVCHHVSIFENGKFVNRR